MTTLSANEIRGHLLSARKRVLALTRDLDGTRLFGPKLDTVNPPLWELGHIAWFQERWCLRRQADESLEDSMLSDADRHYDSAKIAHATRWHLPLVDLKETRSYLGTTLDRVLELLERRPEDPELLYFAELAAAHEDMHAEALHYTWQTLGYEVPLLESVREGTVVHVSARTDDVELPGGNFMVGAYPETGFVFDNEKWAHEARVAPFAIARTPVTNQEYLAFVEARGYARRELWSDDGWAWRCALGLVAPRYWRRLGELWMERRFDRIAPLNADHPVMHVSWHEAHAYCAFAQRRLPTELEWEFAATFPHTGRGKTRFPWGDAVPTPALANLESQETVSVHAIADGDSLSGSRQMVGNVWEWTESTFQPYPGFVRDPYQEYSEPWFGTHKVLRGGSFATPSRLIRNTWRNFYLPERSDPFVGFRTCRLDR